MPFSMSNFRHWRVRWVMGFFGSFGLAVVSALPRPSVAGTPTFSTSALRFTESGVSSPAAVEASHVVADSQHPGRDLRVQLDLDGNNTADMVQVDRETRAVTIRRRAPGGTGEAATDYSSESFTLDYQPTGVVVTDLNNDGRPDFTVAMNGDVSVIFNQGLDAGDPPALGFAPPVQISHVDQTLTFLLHLAAGDVNDDGLIDLVATGDFGDGAGGNTARVAVFINLGPTSSYAFAAPIFHDLPPAAGQTSSYAGELTLGDVNGDEQPDLATIDYAGQALRVLTNVPGSGFTAPTTYSTGEQHPVALAVGDVSRDDRRDLVTFGFSTDIAGATQSSIVIARNVADGQGGFGSFEPQGPFVFHLTEAGVTVEAVGDVAIGPVEADEFSDVVVVDGISGKTVVLSATPQLDAGGAFTGFEMEKAEFATAPGARRLALGDLNSDLKLDVLTGQPTAPGGNDVQLSVLFNSSVNTPTPAGSRIVYSVNGGLGLMDPDGSNKIDLTGADYGGSAAALSTDGTHVAFVGFDFAASQQALFVMKAEPAGPGNVPVALRTGSDVLFNARPTWSPDGRRLIYTAQHENSDHLFMVTAVNAQGQITPEHATTNPSRKLTTGSAFSSDPAFAPNGRQVLFCRLDSTILLLTILDDQGAVTPESANNPAVQLNATQSGVQSSRPAWFPDGSRIAFLDRTVSDARLSALTIRDESGALTTESSGNPRVALTPWSADILVDHPAFPRMARRCCLPARLGRLLECLHDVGGAGERDQPAPAADIVGGEWRL